MALTVGPELDGAADSFGDRFWTAVLGDAPEVGARLAAGGSIQSVEYADRYVRNPVALRMFAEVAGGLRQRSPAAMHGAVVRLVTIPILQVRKGPKTLDTDWNPNADRADVFEQLLAHRGLQGELLVQPKAQSPHARELRLTWTDGASWRLRLDEGLGFLRAAGSPRFDFEEPEREQGRMLALASFAVEVRNESHLYSFGVQTGGTAPP